MSSRVTSHREKALLLQAAFRALLSAMSRPGSVVTLPREDVGDDGGGVEGCMLVIRSLLDHEVSFCALRDGEADLDLERRVSDLTGSRATEVEKADFVLVRDGDSRGRVRRAKRGTWEFPEEGATVIYEVRGLVEGAKGDERIPKDEGFLAMRLCGPGVEGERVLVVSGFQKAEAKALLEARKQFPLGIDAILCDADGNIACLPRSTRIAMAEGEGN